MLFIPVFGATNSVPYVPKLFLILSRTSHNELQLKFVWWSFGKKKSTPNELQYDCGEARR